jgi:pimeloyl-ACP methyl ester carboxylesterase
MIRIYKEVVMKRCYVDIPEGQVHYQTDGSGELILLLHQTPSSSNEYAKVIPILAQKYCVIAMDTLGYGDSDKPPQIYQISDYARSVISFLDALGIARTHVAGHHTGGIIGVELATGYPDRVNKLILSGCSCRKQPEEGQMMLNRILEFPIKADGSHLTRLWQMFAGMTDRELSPVSLDILQTAIIDYLKAGSRVEDGHKAAFIYDNYAKLPLIKCPTLLLYGNKDMLFPYHDLCHSLVPNNTIKIMEGSGAPIQMPQEWAQSVLDFLSSQSA